MPALTLVLQLCLLSLLAITACNSETATAQLPEITVEHSTATSVAATETPVFPRAEGFGTETIAGRFGELCKVQNLYDAGPGSLRHCIELDKPRTVIFDVGGVIHLKTPLVIQNPFISIFGQTAPFEGIMITISTNVTGPVLQIKSHDVLVQHLRFRAGASIDESCCRDAVSIGSDTPGAVYNVVFDHNSVSWGTDEIIDVWNDSHNVTISWTIISESIHDSTNKGGPAGRGMLIAAEKGHSTSIHHNYFSSIYQRTPLIGTPGVTDVVNNLVYHWVSRGAGVNSINGVTQVNFVKNKFVAKTKGAKNQVTQVNWFDITAEQDKHELHLYLEGNLGHHRKKASDPEWSLLGVDYNTVYNESLGWVKNQRFEAPPVTEYPTDTLEEYILPYVGAVLPKRDSVDQRVIKNLKKKSGYMANCVSAQDPPFDGRCLDNYGGWPQYRSSDGDFDAQALRTDTDNDGIPDVWEEQKDYLSPVVKDAHIDHDKNGYTSLEEWIFSLERVE